jgi:hypothetical protein
MIQPFFGNSKAVFGATYLMTVLSSHQDPSVCDIREIKDSHAESEQLCQTVLQQHVVPCRIVQAQKVSRALPQI